MSHTDNCMQFIEVRGDQQTIVRWLCDPECPNYVPAEEEF